MFDDQRLFGGLNFVWYVRGEVTQEVVIEVVYHVYREEHVKQIDAKEIILQSSDV